MKPQRPLRDTLCSQKEFPLSDITEQILSCAMEVHSTLGPGLLENIYEEALAHEFSLRGIEYVRQKEISLRYKGKGRDKEINQLEDTEGVNRLFVNVLKNIIFSAICGKILTIRMN